MDKCNYRDWFGDSASEWQKEMKRMKEEAERVERLRMKELPGILKRAGWTSSYSSDDLMIRDTITMAFHEVFTPRSDVSFELVRYTLDFFKTIGHYNSRGRGNFSGAQVMDAILRCFEMRKECPIDSVVLLVMTDVTADTYQRELVYLWHDLHPEPSVGWCIFCHHCIDAEGRRLDREEYPYYGGGRDDIRVMCNVCYEEGKEEKRCHVCVHSMKNCDDDSSSIQCKICNPCRICVEGYEELVDPKSEAWKNKPSRKQWKLRAFEDYWGDVHMCCSSHNGARD